MLSGRFEDDLLEANWRISAVGLVDDLLKLVVSNDGQTVHGADPGAFSVWEAQTTPNGLLDEDAGVSRAERDDGV